MSKDAINFLTNLKEEVDKYIAGVDLEAVEKAADIIMDAESKRKSCSCNWNWKARPCCRICS